MKERKICVEFAKAVLDPLFHCDEVLFCLHSLLPVTAKSDVTAFDAERCATIITERYAAGANRPSAIKAVENPILRNLSTTINTFSKMSTPKP